MSSMEHPNAVSFNWVFNRMSHYLLWFILVQHCNGLAVSADQMKCISEEFEEEVSLTSL